MASVKYNINTLGWKIETTFHMYTRNCLKCVKVFESELLLIKCNPEQQLCIVVYEFKRSKCKDYKSLHSVVRWKFFSKCEVFMKLWILELNPCLYLKRFALIFRGKVLYQSWNRKMYPSILYICLSWCPMCIYISFYIYFQLLSQQDGSGWGLGQAQRSKSQSKLVIIHRFLTLQMKMLELVYNPLSPVLAGLST